MECIWFTEIQSGEQWASPLLNVYIYAYDDLWVRRDEISSSLVTVFASNDTLDLDDNYY